MASPVSFRFAQLSDTNAIVALVEASYRGDSSRRGWTTEADLLGGQRTDVEEVTGIIGDPHARLLLAFADGVLVGNALIKQQPLGAYIGMLAIRPQYQAAGIGRQLLLEAEQAGIREFSATRAWMSVIIQREELIGWYERRGYVRTARREPFPYGNPRFGLPKRDDLEFIVLEKTLH